MKQTQDEGGVKSATTGFSLFDSMRKSEGDEHRGLFSRAFSQTFLTLKKAEVEAGVHVETLLELAYQSRIILIFPRPSNVEIHKGQAIGNKFLSIQQEYGRDFLVMPSSGCYPLIFKEVTDVYDTSMAISFSHSRGFFVSALTEDAPISFSEFLLRPGVSEVLRKIEAKVEAGELVGFKADSEGVEVQNTESVKSKNHPSDWRDAKDVEVWDRWIFMERGNRVFVKVKREDLYIHADELDLALEILKNSTREKVENFHSDELQYLKQASRIFWGASSVIEDKTSTHPKIKKVATWLMENAGMSESVAKTAASIIRPSFAKPGRHAKPENDE